MQPTIRLYHPDDKEKCIAVFKSNLPGYFDESELPLFEEWLNARETSKSTYQNSEKDFYYVMEIKNAIVGCGGFYLIKNENSASMSWGMIHRDYHKKGFGKLLLDYRIKEINALKDNVKILLGTSQHTFGFFEKCGFEVLSITKDGYANGIDKYEMKQIAS